MTPNDTTIKAATKAATHRLTLSEAIAATIPMRATRAIAFWNVSNLEPKINHYVTYINLRETVLSNSPVKLIRVNT